MNLDELFDRGNYREAIHLAIQVATPEALLVGAQAAIHRGDYRLAEELLAFDKPPPTPTLRAEQLALQGALRYYQGDLEGLRRLSLQAANLAPTFLTLFMLSRSRPPREGILLLQEAEQLASRPAQKSRVIKALAGNYARLGRYRDALHNASLAQLRNPTPNFFLSWTIYALYGSDEIPLENLMRRLTPYLTHEAPGIRLDALCTLAEIYLMDNQIELALERFEEALPLMNANQVPFAALLGLRIYRALGDTEKVYQLALAAQVAAPLSQLHQGVAALVMGQALFPGSQSRALLEETRTLLQEESPLEALKASVYLAALDQRPLSSELILQLEQWSWRGRCTLPQTVSSSPSSSYRLQALGHAALTKSTGPVALRPRSIELLVLLLAHPAGYDRERLSEALYGRFTPRALHSELLRLRKALEGGIAPGPWRATLPITADFVELRKQLNKGNLSGAVELYRGPLLPDSRAPGIEALRHTLEEELRLAVLARNDYALLYQLCERLPDDLELWENLLERTPGHNPRHPAVLARVRRLQREYTAH